MAKMALYLDLILEPDIPMASRMVWILFPREVFHEISIT